MEISGKRGESRDEISACVDCRVRYLWLSQGGQGNFNESMHYCIGPDARTASGSHFIADSR